MKAKKQKVDKLDLVTIQAPSGSIVIVPQEIVAFKKQGIDLSVAIKKIQKEIHKKYQRK